MTYPAEEEVGPSRVYLRDMTSAYAMPHDRDPAVGSEILRDPSPDILELVISGGGGTYRV